MDFSPDTNIVYCGDLNCCLSDGAADGGNYNYIKTKYSKFVGKCNGSV